MIFCFKIISASLFISRQVTILNGTFNYNVLSFISIFQKKNRFFLYNLKNEIEGAKKKKEKANLKHFIMHRSDTTPLLDVAVYGIQTSAPNISQETLEEIQCILQMLISGKISYEECKEKAQNLGGQHAVGAVDKVNDVLTVPKTPLNDFVGSQESQRKRAHSWTPEEDKRLLYGITKFGLSNWADISKFVGNARTRSQCSQRWHRSLNPRICKERWSAEDDQKLQHYVQVFGDHAWTKVAQALGCRADVQCRYRYQLILKRNQVQQPPAKPKSATMRTQSSAQSEEAFSCFPASKQVKQEPERAPITASQFQAIYLTHGSSYQPQTEVSITPIPQIQPNSIFSEFVESEHQQPSSSSDSIFDENIWDNIFTTPFETNEQNANTTLSDSLMLF